jgi:addiction module RelE/StbE family toxin
MKLEERSRFTILLQKTTSCWKVSSRFAVQLTDQAQKDLKRLRPWTSQALLAIQKLEVDPYLGHTLTGSLRGARSLEFSLKGGGEYRAVYVVLENEQVCIVFIVGSHENIYDRAARRVEALKRSGQI